MTIAVEIQHILGTYVVSVLVAGGSKEGWELRKKKKERKKKKKQKAREVDG